MSTARSWLIAWVRALTAPRRVTRSTRMASVAPARDFGALAADPFSTARAAA
jgi:hypothetical protein